jgi:hypothetical protein
MLLMNLTNTLQQGNFLRHTARYWFLFSGLMALLLFNHNQRHSFGLTHSEEEMERGADKQEMLEAYYQQEFDKIYDHSTGTVPLERLEAALKYAQSPAAKRNKKGPTANLNLQWQERGPNNVAGRSRAMLIDKNDPTKKKVWIGSVAGGLWHTNDISAASTVWVPSNDLFANLAVTAIAQDPTSPNIMYFGTGEGYSNSDAVRGLGAYKSIDGGNTWAQLASTNPKNATAPYSYSSSPWRYCQRMVVLPNHAVLAATWNGLQRSTDGGITWVSVLNNSFGSGVTDLKIAANGSIYASLGTYNTSADGVYRSDNGGLSFTKIYTAASTEKRIEMAVAMSDSNTLYLAVVGSGNVVTSILKTVGATGAVPIWLPLSLPMWSDQCGTPSSNFTRSQAWYDLSLAVSPTNPNNVYIGGVDIHHSLDGGSTWKQLTDWSGSGCNGTQFSHGDQHSFVFVDDANAYCTSDGGIFAVFGANSVSPSFVDRNKTYNVTQFYAADIHPSPCSYEVIAGAQDNGTHAMTLSGNDASIKRTGGDGGFCHINQLNPNFQVSSYTYNNYNVTTNNWVSNNRVSSGTSAGSFINPTDLDDSLNILYTAHTGGNFGRLNLQNFASMEIVPVADLGGYRISAIKVDPNIPTRVWMAVNTGSAPQIIRVDNAHQGTPLRASVVSLPMGSIGCVISSIDIQKGNSDHLMVTSSSYGATVPHIMESTNGGTGWNNITGNFPDVPVRWGIFNPQNPSQAIIATEIGVWSTDLIIDANTQWFSDNGGLANVRVDMIKYRSSDYTLVAATHGRGTFTAKIPPQGVYAAIERNQSVIASGNVGPNQDVYFYTGNSTTNGAPKLIARIQNLSSTDFGCTSLSVIRGSSASATPLPFYYANDATKNVCPKMIQVNPSNTTASGTYRIYLYYDAAEINAYQTSTTRLWANAQVIKCPSNLTGISPSTPRAGGLVSFQANDGNLASGLSFISATFTNAKMGAYGVGIPGGNVGNQELEDSRFDFSVYPNPATDYVHVRFGGLDGLAPSLTANVFLTDALGRQVYAASWQNLGGGSKVIPTAELVGGTYILTIQEEGRKAVSKLLIVNR